MEKQIFAQKPTDPKGPWDVIIIGSGPSAFTSAIYTTRGAASTLILGGEVWGGQLMLTSTVDNFPGFPEGIQGPDLMSNMKAQAERFGAQFLGVNVTSINDKKKPFEITAGGIVYQARLVLRATLHFSEKRKWLLLEGEILLWKRPQYSLNTPVK